jgi:hypothetical protein
MERQPHGVHQIMFNYIQANQASRQYLQLSAGMERGHRILVHTVNLLPSISASESMNEILKFIHFITGLGSYCGNCFPLSAVSFA